MRHAPRARTCVHICTRVSPIFHESLWSQLPHTQRNAPFKVVLTAHSSGSAPPSSHLLQYTGFHYTVYAVFHCIVEYSTVTDRQSRPTASSQQHASAQRSIRGSGQTLSQTRIPQLGNPPSPNVSKGMHVLKSYTTSHKLAIKQNKGHSDLINPSSNPITNLKLYFSPP